MALAGPVAAAPMTVSLGPVSGFAGVYVLASVQTTSTADCGARASLQAGVFWDGSPAAATTMPLTWDAGLGACVGAASFPAPADASPGPHAVATCVLAAPPASDCVAGTLSPAATFQVLPPLTLSASHGAAALAVTATYGIWGCDFGADVGAQFFWDGAEWGTATWVGKGPCLASATLVPPAGATPGIHAVTACVAILAATGHACSGPVVAPVAYTIDPEPTPTPTPTPRPTSPPPTEPPFPSFAPSPPPAPGATPAPSLVPSPTPAPTPGPSSPPTPGPMSPGTPVPASPTPAASATAPVPSASVPDMPDPGSPGPQGPTIAPTQPAGTPGATAPGPTPSDAGGPVSATPSAAPGSMPSAPPDATASPAADPAASPEPPAGAVLGAVGGQGTPGGPGGGASNADLLPALAASVPGPAGLDLDPNVILTNLGLTALFVLLFALTAEVFNSTLDTHREEIHAWWGRQVRGPLRVLAPIAVADARLGSMAGSGRAGSLLQFGIVLVVIGFIYGFLSSDFGLNERSLLLMAAIAAALGFLTYLVEGGSSLLARRRYGARSSVRLYGTAILVAIACVLISKLGAFSPGIVYGFVASSIVIAPVALAKRDEAMLVVVPALALLAVSVLAFILLGAASGSATSGSWQGSFIQTVLAIVFIAGLEGLVFTMLPLRFMDGSVVMRWSRAAWALLFGAGVFLWWQLLLNRDRAYLDSFRQANVQLVAVALVFFMATTGLVWGYFRFRPTRTSTAG